MSEIDVSHNKTAAHRQETAQHKTVAEAFGAAATTYDASRRRLVPCFDDFYRTALRFVTLDLPEAPRVLDLGAGTGLFAALVAGVRPKVSLTLVDSAAPMLDAAGRALSGLGIAADLRHQDLADPLPDGQFDAVISALAIHHVDDPGKRDLYRRVRGILAPGGVFVNAEQVAGPTPRLDRMYDSLWEADARAFGSDDQEVAAARVRMAFDRPATVAAQLDWVTEAGLVDAFCAYQNLRFAVLVGWAPTTPTAPADRPRRPKEV
ncbi:class I SAM-dependent methyltransferase [Actinopolymorpha alba]|uniref:class I SAM-dependent methyltransferase n=1 Tax=Actinopolymorpha alba TaxID=533267 RepID=UPI00037A3D6C|nr:class I SAM-dependent methyltransferase [Actinopolymorpha alba]